MIEFILDGDRWAHLAAWFGLGLMLVVLAAVIVERVIVACSEVLHARFARHYRPILERALHGDATAMTQVMASSPRRRVALARLLIEPLIDDRNLDRISRTRRLLRKIPATRLVERMLHSRRWWRRALALRAFGLIQNRQRTPELVSALDDPHPEVRAAALDALADMHDPVSLPAIVVRMHDRSLHRGRRAAALMAFGQACEPLLLDLADVDAEHRQNYAAALRFCGTKLARVPLTEWTHDARPDVRVAAFQALGSVGLDDRSAPVAIEALESSDENVRAMAAYALRGWEGPGDAAAHLSAHLEDAWPVAVQAAEALRAMPHQGIDQLRASTSRPGLAGALARQMLWEARARC